MIRVNYDNSIVLLSLEDCEIIYEREKQHNADFYARRENLLESAISSINYKAEALKLDVLDIAVSYYVHVACGHVFIDGNKRFSVTFLIYFLELNGYELKVTKNFLRNLTIEISHEDASGIPFDVKKDYVCHKIRPFLQKK
jgi:death-on-curing family protein